MSLLYASNVGAVSASDPTSGTTLVLPGLVGVQVNDLIFVGTAFDDDAGIGSSCADDLGNTIGQVGAFWVPSLSRHIVTFSVASGFAGTAVVTITLSAAKTNRAGYACVFRSSLAGYVPKVNVPVGASITGGPAGPTQHIVGLGSNNSTGVVHVNGVCVNFAEVTSLAGPGDGWIPAIVSDGHIVQYKSIFEDSSFPTTVRELGTPDPSSAILSGGDFVGDARQGYWGAATSARLLKLPNR